MVQRAFKTLVPAHSLPMERSLWSRDIPRRVGCQVKLKRHLAGKEAHGDLGSNRPLSISRRSPMGSFRAKT